MTRFDYYAHVEKRPRRGHDWPVSRVLLWLLLSGGLAFWVVVLWTTLVWAPR